MKEDLEKRIAKINMDLEHFWDTDSEKKDEAGKRLAFLNLLYNALYNDFY